VYLILEKPHPTFPHPPGQLGGFSPSEVDHPRQSGEVRQVPSSIRSIAALFGLRTFIQHFARPDL
jgi:hypothetical protein